MCLTLSLASSDVSGATIWCDNRAAGGGEWVEGAALFGQDTSHVVFIGHVETLF